MPLMHLGLYSAVSNDHAVIDRLGKLTIIGCDVSTLPSLADAATGPAPPLYSKGFFLSSFGTLELRNSRFLVTSAVRLPVSCLGIVWCIGTQFSIPGSDPLPLPSHPPVSPCRSD